MSKTREALLKQLRAEGFKISPPKPPATTKKTFEVDNDQLRRFEKVVRSRQMKIKVAVYEMIESWLAKWEE